MAGPSSLTSEARAKADAEAKGPRPRPPPRMRAMQTPRNGQMLTPPARLRTRPPSSAPAWPKRRPPLTQIPSYLQMVEFL